MHANLDDAGMQTYKSEYAQDPARIAKVGKKKKGKKAPASAAKARANNDDISMATKVATASAAKARANNNNLSIATKVATHNFQ